MDYPSTLSEAKQKKYNQWAGNPEGTDYQIGYCAYEMLGMFPLPCQCSRKAKTGPSKLYCKQHSKKI